MRAVIASWYQGADAPGLTTFVSTGEIISETLFRDELVNELLSTRRRRNVGALDLLSHLPARARLEGRMSAVPGWSRLWVR